ncbi:MAG: alpha/beta hydrolase [Deltaproteobacteria bacterium]|nr:alpha/beta hydrolase [Deltaproteobacteria bacterium]
MQFPARVVVVALTLVASSSCLSWSNLWRKSNAVRTADGVAYIDDGDDKHKLTVFAPQGAQGVPVVVFVHGGFWRSGDRSVFEPLVGLYSNVGVALADNDVVTVIPSYRLFPQVGSVEDMLDDVAAAIAWTRDHVAVHGGDPNRIILAGHSAGGHLVSLIASRPDALKKRGVDPSVIKGVVSLSGIFDIPGAAARAKLEEDRVTLWRPLFDAHGKEQSPAVYFGEHMTPTLFLVGENDYETCLVDYRKAEKSLAHLVGDRAFFRFIPKNTHEEMVLTIGTADDAVSPAVAAFAHFATR